MKNKLINALTVASIATATTVTVIFGLTLTVSRILMDNQANVTNFLGQPTSELIPPKDDYDVEDTIYYDTNFSNLKEVKSNGEDVALKIAQEGFTLLKNKDNALPLASGASINMYSMSSYDPVYNGTGDCGRALDNNSASLLDGLTDAGFSVNTELFNWYKANYSSYGRKERQSGGTMRVLKDSIYKQYSINDANWAQITTPAKENEADVGMFIVSRIAGEGNDVTLNYSGYSPDMKNGNYLRLSDKERDVLTNMKAMKDAGKLSKIVVVLNFSNQVECKFIDEDALGIDAAIWVGNMGQMGAIALGQVLNGEINPSGKLVDTFWKEHQYNPVLTNFGPANTSVDTFSFQGAGGLSLVDGADRYVNYTEGIYVGYRYTETRYEDIVLNRAKVGTYNYNDVVSYPFGHGLSYTSFDYSNFSVVKQVTNDEYKISVDVTNTGSIAGKESVQFYISKPYTDYDITNGIEKAAVDLVGFEKTKILKPGETQTISYTVTGNVFTSYDAYNAKTYVLDEGDYYFSAGRDAHDATNNVLKAKGGADESKMVDIGGFGKGNAALTAKFHKGFDDKTYSVSQYTGAEVTNHFDNVDMKTYEHAAENKDAFKYISRDDWDGTVKLAWDNYETGKWAGNETKFKANADMANDCQRPVLEPDTDPSSIPDVTYEAEHKLSIIDLMSDKIPYDDPMWEQLLDQLSFEDTCNLVGYGMGFPAIASIDFAGSWDMDSAVGVSESSFGKSSKPQSFANYYKDQDRNTSRSTSYPGNDLVAATYNIRVIEEEGEAWGEDMLWIGYTAIYGPGLNLHRSPYGGRNYNYFSEDGLVTGIGGTYISKGVRSKGCHVIPKHMFLNEQETNRIGGTTWANEQSIREIYMKCAEMPLSSGYAQGCMTSLSRMGMQFCGHQGYLNTVFRNEFGQVGYNCTDSTMEYMIMPVAVMAGQDGDIYGGAAKLKPYKPEQGYKSYAIELRKSAHRMLYSLAHSNAMNFLAPGMTVKTLTPQWIQTVDSVNVVSTVLFVVGAVFLAGMLGLNLTLTLIGKKKQK